MSKKILIFEDDAATAEFVEIVARQLGYDVTILSKTDNVLNDVLSESPDLILMDNWIPGQGGFSSVELLKSTPVTSAIPIIFYSANTDFKSLAETSKADAILTKPFDISDIEEIIVRLIGQ